tara:strand:- start:1234 stop:5508 length:4275 start_codon:yes stop_codon:yes gene_type:complete
MVDIGQVEQSVLDTYGPRVEGPYGMDFAKNVKVTKADKIYDINFSALAQMEPPSGDNQYGTEEIARALVKFIALDKANEDGITDPEEINARAQAATEKYDKGVLEGSISPTEFLYKYSNVAPEQGPLSRFTQFFLEGATKGAATLAPAIAGAKVASEVAPGRLKKPAAVAGFVGRLVLGDTVAERIAREGQSAGIFEGRPVRPEERVYAVGGDIAGFNASAIYSSPYLLPKKAYNTFSGMLVNDALLQAKSGLAATARIPFRASRTIEKGLEKAGAAARGELGPMQKFQFFGSETAMGIGATTGGMIAESVDPGDKSSQVIGEVGGGIIGAFTPSSLILRFAPSILSRVSKGMGEDAQLTNVGTRLKRIIEERSNGETVEEILVALEENPVMLKQIADDIFGDESLYPQDLTPAAVTGSPILGRLQRDVSAATSKLDPDSSFPDEIDKRVAEGEDFVARLVQGLRASGSQEDLKTAATIASEFQAMKYELQLIRAQERAAAPVDFLQRGAANSAVVSRRLFTLLEQVNNNARRQEQVLYQQIDGAGIPVDNVDFIANALPFIRQKYLSPGSEMPTNVRAELGKIQSEYGINFGLGDSEDLLKARAALDTLPEDVRGTYDTIVELAFGKNRAGQNVIPEVNRQRFLNAPRPGDDALDNLSGIGKGQGFAPDFIYDDTKSQAENMLLLIEARKGQLSEVMRMSDAELREAAGGAFAPTEAVTNAKAAIAASKRELADLEKTVKIELQLEKLDPESAFFQKPEIEYTFNDLKKMRSTVRRAAAAASAGDPSQGGVPNKELAAGLGELIGAIDQQMDEAIEAIDPSNAAAQAYAAAKAFSSGRQKAIVRTFGGSPLVTDTAGGGAYHADLLFDEIISGGVGPATVKLKEIINSGTVVQRMLDDLNVAEELRVPRPGNLDAPQEIIAPTSVVPDITRSFEPVPTDNLFSASENAARLIARKVMVADEEGFLSIDPRRAAEFLESPDNQELLRLFPNLRAELQDGQSFEVARKLAETEANQNLVSEVVKQQTALGTLLRGENPELAISKLLDAENPREQLRQLVRQIKDAKYMGGPDDILPPGQSVVAGDPKNLKGTTRLTPSGSARSANQFERAKLDAMEGLKSSILSTIFARGGDDKNFSVMLETLFKPLKGSAPISAGQSLAAVRSAKDAKSLADRIPFSNMLVDEGVFTRAEMDRLRYIFEAGKNIQVADAGGKAAGKLAEEMNFLMSGLVRILGSSAVSTAAQKMPGLRPQGLVEAGIGARMAQKLFGDVPANMQIKMLEKAVLDKDFMTLLLTKAKKQEEAQRLAGIARTYLIGAGLTLPESDIPAETQEYFERPTSVTDPDRGDAAKIMRPRIDNTPATSGQPLGPVSMAPPPPRVSTPAPLSARNPSAGILAQAPANPNLRTQMAAAFPGDGITSLLAARRT